MMRVLTHRRVLTRRRVFQGVAAAASLTALNGCARALSGYAGLGTDVTVRKDLAYGPAERHRLDLYSPSAPTADTPLVLFLYGGSWRWGSKERYGFVGYPLAEAGFMVAVADYRLYPDVRFPGFNEDAARAVAWLTEKRPFLELDPGPVHLIGHSAGAHIAALLALDPRYLENVGLTQEALGRFVGLAGPYGFFPSKVRYVADVFPPANQEDQARPLTFARPGAPEMLLLHGADDGTVAAKNSKEMAAALTASGSRAKAKIYPDLGHKEIILALTSPFQGLGPVLSDTTAFLRSGDLPRASAAA